PGELRLHADLGALLDLAIREQPEVALMDLQQTRAEAALAAVQREYKPDFIVQGGYMLAPNMTDAWMGRVGITWPNARWSRGKLESQAREQQAAIEAAKARRRATENAVALAVREAFVKIDSAQQRAALVRTTVMPQARQTL